MSYYCNVNGDVTLKPEIDQEKFEETLEKFLHDECTNFDFDSNGNVISISADGNYYDKEHTALLDFLKPYIESGCILCNGEDSTWRYVFKDDGWETEYGQVFFGLETFSDDKLLAELKKRSEAALSEKVDNIGELDRDDLGCAIVDAFYEDDNYACDIGKGVINCFSNCQTEREYKIADEMLTAVCGYCIDSLASKI